MKRVLFTSISNSFDEYLVEYFIRHGIRVRIITGSIDAGSSWLKLPVEIWSCDEYTSNDINAAMRACHCVIRSSKNINHSGKPGHFNGLSITCQEHEGFLPCPKSKMHYMPVIFQDSISSESFEVMAAAVYEIVVKAKENRKLTITLDSTRRDTYRQTFYNALKPVTRALSFMFA